MPSLPKCEKLVSAPAGAAVEGVPSLIAFGCEGRVTPPVRRRLISPCGKTKLPPILKE